MNRWRIAQLAKNHHRTDFDCGEESLNLFLRAHAGQNARRDFSRTYVATEAASDLVAGFYTLSSGSIAFARLPDEIARKLPKYPVPAAHLGRLAVDRRYHGQGLGGILLIDALKRVRDLAADIGINVVTVQALNERAVQLYKAYGFISFHDDSHHLFLPLATIRKLWP